MSLGTLEPIQVVYIDPCVNEGMLSDHGNVKKEQQEERKHNEKYTLHKDTWSAASALTVKHKS